MKMIHIKEQINDINYIKDIEMFDDSYFDILNRFQNIMIDWTKEKKFLSDIINFTPIHSSHILLFAPLDYIVYIRCSQFISVLLDTINYD